MVASISSTDKFSSCAFFFRSRTSSNFCLVAALVFFASSTAFSSSRTANASRFSAHFFKTSSALVAGVTKLSVSAS